MLVDKQGTIKILDLGLARFTDERSDNLTVQQGVEILGTVDFMAPEQSLDGPWVDHRADIYSLGASLYFMLTGKTPLPDGPSHSKILAAQIHVPTRMSQIRPEIDPRLEEIVGKMMAKTPDRRYQHARDVIAALIAWQKNAPVNLTRQPAIETPADHVSGRSTASAALHSRPTWVKPTSGPIVEEPLQAEEAAESAVMTALVSQQHSQRISATKTAPHALSQGTGKWHILAVVTLGVALGLLGLLLK